MPIDFWQLERHGEAIALIDEHGQALSFAALALLPETLPQPWDELMLQPAYMQALDWVV